MPPTGVASTHPGVMLRQRGYRPLPDRVVMRGPVVAYVSRRAIASSLAVYSGYRFCARAQAEKLFRGPGDFWGDGVQLFGKLPSNDPARFGGDPAILGQVVSLNSLPHVVIGVLPPKTSFLGVNAQLFVPMAFEPGDNLNTHNNYFLTMVGRVKSGRTTTCPSSLMSK